MDKTKPLENVGEYSRQREEQSKEEVGAWQGADKESQCDFTVFMRGIKKKRVEKSNRYRSLKDTEKT